jgi:hypothetical protein
MEFSFSFSFSIRTLGLVMGTPRRDRRLAAIFYSRQARTRRQRNARRVAAVLADRGRNPETDLTVNFWNSSNSENHTEESYENVCYSMKKGCELDRNAAQILCWYTV